MITDQNILWTKHDLKMIERLRSDVLQSLIANGAIDPRGKSERQILDAFYRITVRGEGPWLLVLDHTPTLLKDARRYARSGKLPYACLFYGLWLEHFLNSLISAWAHRQHCAQKVINTLIRETNLQGKCIWLWLVLKGRPPSEVLLSLIHTIAEKRNQFVHYKWHYQDMDDGDKTTAAELKRAIEGAETLVRQLQALARDQIFFGKKRRVAAIARGAPTTR